MAIKVPKDREVPSERFTPAPVRQQELFITSNWRIVRPVIDHEKCTPLLYLLHCLSDSCWSFNEKEEKMEWNWKFCKGCQICIHECPADALSAAPELDFEDWGCFVSKTFLIKEEKSWLKKRCSAGCAAAAQGAKFAEVEVICSFPSGPIRPS